MLIAFFAGMVSAFYLLGAVAVWMEETEMGGVDNRTAFWTALRWPWFALRGVIRRLLGKE